jgi:hypothetical protein
MNIRSQQTIQDREELIEIGEKEATPMEVVSHFENGGETEEAAKGQKDSIADVQELLFSFMRQMQESNDRMTKQFQERHDSMKKEIQENNKSMKKEFNDSIKKELQDMKKEIQENNKSMKKELNESIKKMLQEDRDKLENMLQETRNEIRAPKYRTTTSVSEQVQENDQRINENESELMDIEIERRAEKNSRRPWEQRAPIEPIQAVKLNDDEEAVAEAKWKLGKRQTDQTFEDAKAEKERVEEVLKGSQASRGAWRKKKFKLLKKNYKFLKKTTEGKSAGEAFQEWLDQVRKKHHEQMNNARRRKARFQHQIPWNPGIITLQIRSSVITCKRRVPYFNFSL